MIACYIAKNDLEVMIFLPLPTMCMDYRHESLPASAYCVQGLQLWTSSCLCLLCAGITDMNLFLPLPTVCKDYRHKLGNTQFMQHWRPSSEFWVCWSSALSTEFSPLLQPPTLPAFFLFSFFETWSQYISFSLLVVEITSINHLDWLMCLFSSYSIPWKFIWGIFFSALCLSLHSLPQNGALVCLLHSVLDFLLHHWL